MISAACSPRFQPLCQYWPMEPNFFPWSGLGTIRLPSQCCNTGIIWLLSMRKRSSDLCKIVFFAHSLGTAKWGFHFHPSCLSLPHLLISLHTAMPKVNSFLWTRLLTNVTPFSSFHLSLWCPQEHWLIDGPPWLRTRNSNLESTAFRFSLSCKDTAGSFWPRVPHSPVQCGSKSVFPDVSQCLPLWAGEAPWRGESNFAAFPDWQMELPRG